MGRVCSAVVLPVSIKDSEWLEVVYIVHIIPPLGYHLFFINRI